MRSVLCVQFRMIYNTLTGIIGAATTLLENGTQIASEDSRRMLMDIQHDAEWLIHMVENLLSVTKITGGTNQSEKAG